MKEIKRQLGELIPSHRNRFSLGRVDGKAWGDNGKDICISGNEIGKDILELGTMIKGYLERFLREDSKVTLGYQV